MANFGTIPGNTSLTPGQTVRRKQDDSGWEGFQFAATKADVGLTNADDTSDTNKPISAVVQSALDNKEPLITSGTTAHYFRGDKSWQVLDKTAVGLSNVDNTTDLGKPVSTATSTALGLKANTSSLAAVALTGAYSDLSGKPSLATVATSGNYNDLSNKPVAKRIETYLGSTDASGNYTITYSSAFPATPDVQPALQAGTVTQVARITSTSTTGFTINVQNRVDVLGLLPSFANVNGASVSVLVTAR